MQKAMEKTNIRSMTPQIPTGQEFEGLITNATPPTSGGAYGDKKPESKEETIARNSETVAAGLF